MFVDFDCTRHSGCNRSAYCVYVPITFDSIQGSLGYVVFIQVDVKTNLRFGNTGLSDVAVDCQDFTLGGNEEQMFRRIRINRPRFSLDSGLCGPLLRDTEKYQPLAAYHTL